MGVYEDMMEQLNEQRALAGAPPIQTWKPPAPPPPQQAPPVYHQQPQYLHEGAPPPQRQQPAAPPVPTRRHTSADIRARLNSSPQMTPQEAERQRLLREREAIDAQLNGMGHHPHQRLPHNPQQQGYLREDMPNPYMGHRQPQQSSHGRQAPPGHDIVMEAVQYVKMLSPHMSQPFAGKDSGLEVAAADAPPAPSFTYDPFREAEPDRDIQNYFRPTAGVGIADQVPLLTQVR